MTCSHSVWRNGLNSGFIGMNQCNWDSTGFTNIVNILWDFSVWIVDDWQFLQVKCSFLHSCLSVAGRWNLESCMSSRNLVCVPVSLDCSTSGWAAAVQRGGLAWASAPSLLRAGFLPLVLRAVCGGTLSLPQEPYPSAALPFLLFAGIFFSWSNLFLVGLLGKFLFYSQGPGAFVFSRLHDFYFLYGNIFWALAPSSCISSLASVRIVSSFCSWSQFWCCSWTLWPSGLCCGFLSVCRGYSNGSCESAMIVGWSLQVSLCVFLCHGAAWCC